MPMVSIKALSKVGQWGGPEICIRAANAAFQRKAMLTQSREAKSMPAPPPANDYWYLREKPIRALYPTRIHAPVFGLDYLRLLAASRVSWNRSSRPAASDPAR
jgi:hypothetical protein